MSRPLVDLSSALRRISERGTCFPLPHGRGDEAHTGGGVDQRGTSKPPLGNTPSDIYSPDLRIDRQPEGIKVRPRNSR